MNIPPSHELLPHCRIDPADFGDLYQMYVVSEGIAGTNLQGQVHLGILHWERLATAGYILRHMPNDPVLTQTGVDVVKFAVMKCIRHRILRCIYDRTSADPGDFTDENWVASSVRVNEPEIGKHINYFLSKKYVVRETNSLRQKLIRITAAGIAAVEGDPDGGEVVMGDKNITHGHNSPIQSRTQNSTQTVTITQQHREELAKLIPLIRADVPKLGLTDPEAKDVELHLKMIELQLEAMKPKPNMIGDCLASVLDAVKTKAMEKGGELVFTWLTHLPMITAMIQSLPAA